MKFIWFYMGAAIDIVALLIAAGMMMQDHFKKRRATNNPSMFMLVLALTALVVLAFYLKSIGQYGFANAALWIPGIPLTAYSLFVLLFVIFKPDMK